MEEAGNYRTFLFITSVVQINFNAYLQTGFTPGLTVDNKPTREGFDAHIKTLDHLATCSLIEQRCREWGVKMWITTVDFAKAFDTIRHRSLWNALAQFAIEPQYISLQRRLCADQQATVLTYKQSDMFDKKRGEAR